MGGIQSFRTGRDIRTHDLLDHNLGGEMSATLAISIAVLTLGSCFASYHLGRDSMRQEIRDLQERKRRWEEFDDQD